MGYLSMLSRTIRLNHERTLNAVSPQRLEELLDAFCQAPRSKRAIVARAARETISDRSYEAGELRCGRAVRIAFHPLMMTIRHWPVPFVMA